MLEGFLFTRGLLEVPLVAHIVIPKDGPLQPWPFSLDPTVGLAFSVMYDTLRLVRHSTDPGFVPGISGQRWWVADDNLDPLQGPVPFPVEIP